MRELSTGEIDCVDGGLLRWVASNLLWEAASAIVSAALEEEHTEGDSCDYYSNMPAGMQ